MLLELLAPYDFAGARVEFDQKTAFHPTDLETVCVPGTVEFRDVPVAAHLKDTLGLGAGKGQTNVLVAGLGIDGPTILRPIGQEEIIVRGPGKTAGPRIGIGHAG